MSMLICLGGNYSQRLQRTCLVSFPGVLFIMFYISLIIWLEINCDFSSNNNVWTTFYALFVGHFLLWEIDWNSVHVFFWQLFWIGILDFRLQNSVFRLQILKVPTERLYFYLDMICLWNGNTFRGPSKHIDLSLCWFSVVSLSATQA